MTRRRTPEPPTNPPEPDHYNENHDWTEQPDRTALEGIGVKEANKIDFTPIIVAHEFFDCRRNHCDATLERKLIFAAEDVVDEVTDLKVEEMSESARRTDYDELTVTNPETGGDVAINPRKVVEESDTGGACTGEPPRV